MTKDIITKMQAHLASGVDTECAVVYLLVELRKLLERERPEPKPIALWMYCHWAMHVDLTQSNTTSYFLQRIDDYASDTIFGLKPNRAYTFIESHHLFRDFVYLDTFRDQLREFLAFYALPTALCDEDGRWSAFLTAYMSVIEDGTLSCEKGKQVDTITVVDRVVISKGHAPLGNSHLPFTIQWDIFLRDGRMCRINLEASPTFKMLGHHIQLFAANSVPR